MHGLSVVVPTLNEEKDLPKCLESVKSIADEILVVDSGSTDDTIAIAKKFGAKVIAHPFKSFSDQRNFSDTQTKNEWILSIEADVFVPKDLATEINSVLKDTRYSAFYIERINEIWGKPVMYTDWGPKDDCHIWLYKKGSGKWQSDVHEEFVTTQPVGKLKHRLYHHNYDTVGEFIDKINKYSEIASHQNRQFGYFYGLKDFFKRYFYKLGFLDGYRGLFLSYLQSVYYVTLWVKYKIK